MPKRSNVLVGMLAASAMAAAALAPASQAQLSICPPGTTNTQYCTIAAAPTIAGTGSSGCAPATLHVNETVTAQAGIGKITIKLDGKTIKTQTSPNIKLTIKPKGLKVGVHTITISVRDKNGKTVTRTIHFRACAPKKPKFTG